MTSTIDARALIRAKVKSRAAAPALSQRFREFHRAIIERKDTDLLPKRFVTIIAGASPLTYFIVSARAAGMGRWCLGLVMTAELDEDEMGVPEIFEGVFGEDFVLVDGTLPTPISFPDLFDWLWDTGWFKTGAITPEAAIESNLDKWVQLVNEIPVS